VRTSRLPSRRTQRFPPCRCCRSTTKDGRTRRHYPLHRRRTRRRTTCCCSKTSSSHCLREGLSLEASKEVEVKEQTEGSSVASGEAKAAVKQKTGDDGHASEKTMTFRLGRHNALRGRETRFTIAEPDRRKRVGPPAEKIAPVGRPFSFGNHLEAHSGRGTGGRFTPLSHLGIWLEDAAIEHASPTQTETHKAVHPKPLDARPGLMPSSTASSVARARAC